MCVNDQILEHALRSIYKYIYVGKKAPEQKE